MADDEQPEQPPADSLADASPGTGAVQATGGSGGSRERPEEDEFAEVLRAGAWATGRCMVHGMLASAVALHASADGWHGLYLPCHASNLLWPPSISAVMRGEGNEAEAVREYAAICRQRAAALKELASGQLQRAARCAASPASNCLCSPLCTMCCRSPMCCSSLQEGRTLADALLLSVLCSQCFEVACHYTAVLLFSCLLTHVASHFCAVCQVHVPEGAG
jgi:hypothetical protein